MEPSFEVCVQSCNFHSANFGNNYKTTLRKSELKLGMRVEKEPETKSKMLKITNTPQLPERRQRCYETGNKIAIKYKRIERYEAFNL